MTTIVTRAGKGSPLTNNEVDANFTNLNDAKIETLTSTDTSVTITGTGSSRDLSVPVNPNVVSGPASATDNAVARFDTTTGKLIQNSTVTIDDNGNASNVNAVSFDVTPATLPTAEGTLYWDSADGAKTLSLVMANGDAVQQIGEEQYFRIKASSAITNGQVVMFSGSVGASGGLTGAPATGLTADQASYVMGIATQDIALNDWGYVTSFGLVRQLNTSAFTEGSILYYDPTVAGGLTATLPSAPNPKVQVCAVVHTSATVGSLFVRCSFGGLLGQYEGDVQITSPANGQLLVRNQTDGKWINTTLTDGTGISITEGAGSVTIANTGVTSVSGTAPIASSGGATPAISISQATTSTNGYLSSTDWNTFNNKQPAGSYLTTAVTSATAGTGISVSASTGAVTFTNTGVTSVTAGSGISVSAGTGGVTISSTVTGATISDDTTTNATRYPLFEDLTTGTLSTVNVSSTKYTFNPATGTLSATVMSASSDERLKENWTDVPPNFLANLAQVKHGVFSRIDNGNREVGVGAQSFEPVLPEAVVTDEKGYLSVNYGGAALVAAIELAKQVQELRAEIDVLKAKVGE